ncbi:hypothetical protein [Pelagicoccus albus]|uniref:Uncharacterized protein n=1 Tax=Pelagicoccus albus TaxID=415222 RepID=A0A7X1B4R4_9BACT|nr:hypothetical protein [Pelagicoccus albus]MBC2605626.1 hypothetical protein [Pelagicoccus albus]
MLLPNANTLQASLRGILIPIPETDNPADLGNEDIEKICPEGQLQSHVVTKPYRTM